MENPFEFIEVEDAEKQLLLSMPIKFGGVWKSVKILIDTGAQADLIRMGFCSQFLNPSDNPINLRMVDGTPLQGGKLSIMLRMEFSLEIPVGKNSSWSFNSEYYEAEIGVDIILSYPTMRKMGLIILTDEGILGIKKGENLINRLTPIRFLSGQAKTFSMVVNPSVRNSAPPSTCLKSEVSLKGNSAEKFQKMRSLK